MKISIKPVDESNWQEIAALEVDEDQAAFVAPNVWSLAEAAYCKNSVPLGIYADEHAVGFLMYEFFEDEGEYKIYRFMIDREHQGKGFGRKALKSAISLIAAIPGCKRITICYVPKNPVAKSFYESVGFTEVGLDAYGEMIAEILVQPQQGGRD